MRSSTIWSIVVVAVVAASAPGQVVSLAETPLSNDCFQTELRTKVDGERIFYQDDQRKTQRITLTAEHKYVEKILAIHAKTGMAVKAARNYEIAKTSTALGGDAPIHSTIRSDRRLTIAQRTDDAFVAYGFHGPFNADELSIVGQHFDTLAVPGLLPGKEVSVGATWDLTNPAALALCGFEALESHKLVGTLLKVEGERATFTISGVAKGIDNGAQAALNITATGVFDIAKKRVTGLEWKQEDIRDQGPVSPAFKATILVTVARLPIEVPEALNDEVLRATLNTFEVPAQLAAISYQDPAGRFELTHPREWHLTGRTDRQTTFRLIERGDFVAQATITPWEKVAAGQHTDPKHFGDQMLESPGWQATNVIDNSTIQDTRGGRYVHRVSAQGMMGELQVVQTFFLVAAPNGEQIVVAFTTRQPQLAKLGARDLAFVEGLEFGKK
jgi:hypothetical protein